MEEVKCDYCDQPMELEKRLLNGTTFDGSGYRRRRFKCILCNLTKMVYGNGDRDEVIESYNAQDAIDKMYQQQSKNNIS